MKTHTGWRSKRIRWLAGGLLALMLLVMMTGLALGGLPPSIDWWVIGTGGQAAQGGNVTLLGALAQPVTGEASGGNLTFASGYWNSQNAGGPAAKIYLPLLKK
jgi:hypothetical protein